MGMYDVFETDDNMETTGVWIDYGDFRVRLASAGQGNKNYIRYAEKKLKPVRKAMDVGALSNERSQALMADIYARTVIVDWAVLVDDEWQQGIEAPDGEIMKFTEENIEAALRKLPRLFMDLQEQAMSLSNFRKVELEEETKNSPSS